MLVCPLNILRINFIYKKTGRSIVTPVITFMHVCLIEYLYTFVGKIILSGDLDALL